MYTSINKIRGIQYFLTIGAKHNLIRIKVIETNIYMYIKVLWND